jgi:hypothetical protein
VIQRKTGRPVQFEITEQTRAAIRDWVANSVSGNGQYLFPSRFHDQPHISTRHLVLIECIEVGEDHVAFDEAPFPLRLASWAGTRFFTGAAIAGGGFFVGEFESHLPQMRRLTSAGDFS